ncbi:hypothetical protein DXN05_15930 [Deminuibacter soli]|uniref:Uncharacterized protein n=1 Tax=Deminuibacter soli TaxID=2291815 RepID=A0A3E1NI84_9BACT|nr:hypothetical protein DXN05_15930 [Deminuibacter soli]
MGHWQAYWRLFFVNLAAKQVLGFGVYQFLGYFMLLGAYNMPLLGMFYPFTNSFSFVQFMHLCSGFLLHWYKLVHFIIFVYYPNNYG